MHSKQERGVLLIDWLHVVLSAIAALKEGVVAAPPRDSMCGPRHVVRAACKCVRTRTCVCLCVCVCVCLYVSVCA